MENDQIKVIAPQGHTWIEGTDRVLFIEAPCQIVHGDSKTIQAERCVLWYSAIADLPSRRVTVYAEGTFGKNAHDHQEYRHRLLRHFVTSRPVQVDFSVTSHEPKNASAFYRRAKIAREPTSDGDVKLAQFNSPSPNIPSGFERNGPTFNAPQSLPYSAVTPQTSGGRRIKIVPRSSVPLNATWIPSPDGTDMVGILDSGANIVISGVPMLGTIDISTDRMVIWTNAEGGQLSLNAPEQGVPTQAPMEFYMEGNIVFRTGNRVIYANSMYYDVRAERGVILDAELLSDLPQYQGVVRLKADILQQVGPGQFHAYDAAFTSSRLGIPKYWFQAESLTIQDKTTPLFDAQSGSPLLDPQTGTQAQGHERQVEAKNNYVFLGGIPVMYWPRFSTDLANPKTIFRRVRFGRDDVFGTRLGVGVDVKQAIGVADRAPGVDWIAGVDYLSKRGWGGGTTLEYELDKWLGINGPARGYLDVWGIHDTGLDNLGADRRALPPEETDRGRVFWQHRQRLSNGVQISGEVGYISDRNFLEQYYEHEWDQWKDEATGIELKFLGGNSSWNLATDLRLNDFFTQTEWLPRFDQYQLGQSAFQDRATWYGHSQIAYAKMKPAETPLDPSEVAIFNPLPYDAELEGIRAGGRHEIDVPMQLGAFKVVPYALGEVMHWGEDLDGEDNTRLYGQAGVRANLPMWRVDPTVKSTLWNLNGMAHKVIFESEFLWADASDDIDEFALYDPIDDDANEHFRRRLVDNTFGGLPFVDDVIPFRFDPRSYAIRSGMQSSVTGPTEIAEDLMLLRLGARQRWQTKRGPSNRSRVVDWMSLDTELTIFPKSDRDNFGETVGMINYDWRWHLGDRLTLMSDGFVDTFSDGLRIFTFGGYISRPERGSVFLGIRSIEGPISSNVVNAAVNYRLSEKWLANVGTSIDFGPAGNIGQRFELTRIGESFLTTVGANIDESRDNVGFGFVIEPRFLQLTGRGAVGGVPIPPAGAYGLE